METNKTILTREIVSLGDRATVGNVKDLLIDCDHNKIGHVVVSNAQDADSSLLAFDDIIAIGDSYVTIRNRNSLVPEASTIAADILSRECRLLGVEMLAESGNHYGFLKGFEFDPGSGVLTRLIAFDSSPVESHGILFLSRDYVFVGSLNSAGGPSGSFDSAAPARPMVTPQPQPVAVPQPRQQPVQPDFGHKPPLSASAGYQPARPTPAFTPQPAPAPAPVSTPAPAPAPNMEVSIKDDLSDLLIGAVVDEEVTSKDGQFTVKKGTTITKAILADAEKHDAALLLTMSIDI